MCRSSPDWLPYAHLSLLQHIEFLKKRKLPVVISALLPTADSGGCPTKLSQS